METNREFLRRSTSSIHEDLDGYMRNADFSDAAVYRRLLEANHAPLKKLEMCIASSNEKELLSGWSFNPRLTALQQDLADLGVVPLQNAEAASEELHNDELLGVLYVLEGSRLGGKMLIRAFQSAQPLLRNSAHRFFSSGDGDWKNFIMLLDQKPVSRDLLFKGAQRAFNEFLESYSLIFGGSAEVAR